MKTYTAEPETIQRDWFAVDTAGQTLGHLATETARHLRGKHKPEYTPHVDTDDYTIIINAEQMRVTSTKTTDKMYYHHSGFPGDIKPINSEKLIAKTPERIIEAAIKDMLPKNPLDHGMYRKLKVYEGANHPHTAQQPQELKI